MSGLRIGALFAGYGGLDMAVQDVWPDAELAWYSEIDKGACKILAHRFPDVPNVGDVTAVDWSQVEPVDVITGGSPCQDLSHAGRRAGMTEGTRSNLWVAMREAIAVVRPRLVVWENVRGAFSAAADSAVEPCPGCVGDGSGVHLRALGRVLGDLSDLGYDAGWYGLRAADVGAAHGRFRVFVVAADSRRLRRDEGWPAASGEAEGGRPLGDVAGRGDAPLRVLPTPTTRDHKDHTIRREPHRPDDVDTLARALTDVPCALLPTPAAHDSGNTVEDHLRKKPGRTVVTSLQVMARGGLLPTPRATDGTKGGPNQAGSSGDLMLPSAVSRLLPTPTVQHSARNSTAGRSPDAKPHADGDTLADLVFDGRLLPTPTSANAADGANLEDWEEARQALVKKGYNGNGRGTPLAITVRLDDQWGDYAAAITRWEHTLGRPAPAPTMTSAKGNPQLSPAFVEWLMGLPAGHITDVPGITRNEALKACGNGVVPQQAAAAIRWLLAQGVAA